MTEIDPHIFRAYDIRGIAYEQLSPEACRLIGRAFGTELKERYSKDHPTVIVGRDQRTHGPELETAVIDGLLSTGCHIQKIGQTPSPVNYFSICHFETDGGVQLTASHNPAEYNGLKLQIRDAEAFSGDSLQELHQRIQDKRFSDGEGSEEDIDAITPYIETLKKIFDDKITGMHVVVDAGNGVSGPVYCQVLREVGCTVTELYTEPDGTFPNHPADPSKWDTLKELQEKVKEVGADCGLAFDGDGDRLGIVDETSTIRTADETLLLLAQDHLSRHKDAPVVFTVSNSGALETEIAKWGGKPIMCIVGHSFVEHAMHEHHSQLGGEQSGHFFCSEEYYPYDDAIVAGLRCLAIISAAQKPLSTLCADFPKVYQAPEHRPHCPDDKKTAIIAAITDHFSTEYPVNTMDGARIDFGDGAWAGIRQSNTSPCISICIEARSEDKLKEVQNLVENHLKSYPEIGE